VAILALDLGLKRIGLAYSPDGKLALPIAAIIRKNRHQAAAEVDAAIAAYRVDRLVVGLPIGGSSEEEMRRRITHFVGLLKSPLAVAFQDEAGSSIEAQERAAGRLGRKKDGRLDSLAAQIILERWLEGEQDV
jgi:putative Holliday junction resolvase